MADEPLKKELILISQTDGINNTLYKGVKRISF